MTYILSITKNMDVDMSRTISTLLYGLSDARCQSNGIRHFELCQRYTTIICVPKKLNLCAFCVVTIYTLCITNKKHRTKRINSSTHSAKPKTIAHVSPTCRTKKQQHSHRQLSQPVRIYTRNRSCYSGRKAHLHTKHNSPTRTRV